jgi:hypothetical protein
MPSSLGRRSKQSFETRTIDAQALGLLFAMTDEQAEALARKLQKMQTEGSTRAALFCGKR